MNSSKYSSIGRKLSENQKQNSTTIDYQSVNSSCVTSKELKSINNFCSSINNYYKNMKYNNSLALNYFHLNFLKSNIKKNKRLKINLIKTKSYDSILPNISETSVFPQKKFRNLKILINNDNNDNVKNNNNNFYVLNKSIFSTTANSLNSPNKSNISNNQRSLKNESSNINSKHESMNKKAFSLNNIYDNDDQDNYYYNYYLFNHKKRENLYEYLDKTRKVRIIKYAQNDLKKIYRKEKEKIESNIEQHELDLNLLKKLYHLFIKYISSFDTYFFHIKEAIRNGKKENAGLEEYKKKLNNEIFALGHTVYKIKNKLKDYLNNKYFLLSVKNHTKNFDYFTTKDQKEFNFDLLMLEKLDERLNTIFVNEKVGKDEKKKKTGTGKSNYFNFDEIKKYMDQKREGNIKYMDFRKRFYSQNSIGESLRVKKIFKSPAQFMKDLNLISKDINSSLKIFNTIQSDLLDDKNLLITLHKQSFENENIAKIFNEKEKNMRNRLNAFIKYNNYLKNQKNNLLSKNKKKNEKNDFILIKIKHILNNIKNNADEKLLKFLENIEYKDQIQNNIIIALNNNNKLNMLKIIEYSIIFLKRSNKEYKENEKEKYHEIEGNIHSINRMSNYKKARENYKVKRKKELIKIMVKANNLLYWPNKKNYYIHSKTETKHKNKKNKENERKVTKNMFDIDFSY